MSFSLSDDLVHEITQFCESVTLFKLEISCKRFNGDFIWNHLDSLIWTQEDLSARSRRLNRLNTYHQGIKHWTVDDFTATAIGGLIPSALPQMESLAVYAPQFLDAVVPHIESINSNQLQYLLLPQSDASFNFAARLLERGCKNLRVLHTSPSFFGRQVTPAVLDTLLNTIRVQNPPIRILGLPVQKEGLDGLRKTALSLAPHLRRLEVHGFDLNDLLAGENIALDHTSLQNLVQNKLAVSLGTLRFDSIRLLSVWQLVCEKDLNHFHGELFDACYPLSNLTAIDTAEISYRMLGAVQTRSSRCVLTDYDYKAISRAIELLSQNLDSDEIQGEPNLLKLLAHLIGMAPLHLCSEFTRLLRQRLTIMAGKPSWHLEKHVPVSKLPKLFSALLQHAAEWTSHCFDLHNDCISKTPILFYLIDDTNALDALLGQLDTAILAATDSRGCPIAFVILEKARHHFQPETFATAFQKIMEMYRRAPPDVARLAQVCPKATRSALEVLFEHSEFQDPFIASFGDDWRPLVTQNLISCCYQSDTMLSQFVELLKKHAAHYGREAPSQHDLEPFFSRMWEHMIEHTEHDPRSPETDDVHRYIATLLRHSPVLPHLIQEFARGKAKLACKIPVKTMRARIERAAAAANPTGQSEDATPARRSARSSRRN